MTHRITIDQPTPELHRYSDRPSLLQRWYLEALDTDCGTCSDCWDIIDHGQGPVPERYQDLPRFDREDDQ